MKNKTLYIVIAIVVIALGLLFFGRDSNTNRITTPTPDGGDGDVASAEVAPDFTLQTLDGGTLTLSEYHGEKPVILDFFATWCPNCRRSMPKLSGFYDAYSDQVEVIGVNLQEGEGSVERYIEAADISFPIVLDPSGVASRAYGVPGTNYHVLINTDGTIFGQVPGDISERDITDLIAAQEV